MEPYVKYWGRACRLWLKGNAPIINSFPLFVRAFESPEDQADLTLRIAADRDFIALLDGVEVGRGQFSDDPMVKTHSDIHIPCMAAGKHVLLIRNYVCGENFLSYAPGEPGIIIRLFNDQFELVSDDAWRGCLDPMFHNGPMPKLTMQLGFTQQLDQRHSLSYATEDGSGSPWEPVEVLPLNSAVFYCPRPVAAWPHLGDFIPAAFIRNGVFYRQNNSSAEEHTPAWLMSRDAIFWNNAAPTLEENGDCRLGSDLSPWQPHPDGLALLTRLPEEATGFLYFSLTASEGTVVDVAHGEHIVDGRVRSSIEQRNFADRFICKEGRNDFELPFRRIAANYIELHILVHNHEYPVVHQVGIRDWSLPWSPETGFSSPDPQLEEIRERSIRTLRLCMHEHYEDCPWREQSLYTYDSRNQMLYGYYLWGNWEYAAVNMDLWQGSQREDGHLRLCAPGRIQIVIPIYSFIYPVQLWEHLLYSGDTACAQRNLPLARNIVDRALMHCDPASGLPIGADSKGWYFYEWVEELSLDGCPPGEVHALYGLYLLEALDALVHLGEYLQFDASAYAQKAAELRIALNDHFWDNERNLYFSRTQQGKGVGLLHEHTQILMRYNRCIPEKRRTAWENALQQVPMIRLTPSVMPYLAQLATRSEGSLYRDIIRQRLKSDYYPMLKDQDMNTVYEMTQGADAFGYAGSMCHGWSALPVYYSQAILLGVMPLEPGFRRFRVMPWDGGLPTASGEIPTPSGRISVAWQKNEQGQLALQVCHPANLECQVVSLPESPVSKSAIIAADIKEACCTSQPYLKNHE